MTKTKYQKPYIIGIGGSGVSNIAHFFLDAGIAVYGSDGKKSTNTEKLEQRGAKVFYSQTAENIETVQPDVVFYSQAVLGGDGRKEFDKAEELGIPTFKNAAGYWEVIGKNKKTIAITGAHGKTTTTAMAGLQFMAADLDPTVIVGSQIKQFDNLSFRNGAGEHFIVEACEYHKQFLFLEKPHAMVILNIEYDHPDAFKDIDETREAFVQLGKQVAEDGFVLAFSDEENSKVAAKAIQKAGKQVYTYGIEDSSADFLITEIEAKTNEPGFTAKLTLNTEHKAIEKFFPVHLETKLFGEQNIWNAAASTLTLLLSNPGKITKEKLERATKVLTEFSSTSRRQEYIGDYQGIPVYDDYAHHPTQIKVTLSAFKKIYKNIHVFFEPHQYSRTRKLLEDFSTSFELADHVNLFPIFEVPGRDTEEDKQAVSIEKLHELMQDKHENVSLHASYDDIEGVLSKAKADNADCILNLGAGPISREIRDFLGDTNT